MMPSPRLLLMATLGLFIGSQGAANEDPTSLTFEQHVRPILKAHCFHCHGEENTREGGLDVRLRRLLVAGGDSGAAIRPGDAHGSYLVERLQRGEMPPDDVQIRPTAEEMRVIEAWIAQGAKTARPEPESLDAIPTFTEEERSHWAFQPVERPEPPAVRHADQVRTPIDRFVLARLEGDELCLSDPADPITLIRRAFFDLTGLPPSPERVEAYEADADDEAYEQLIDELLTSPRYGEKWARHWLDLAGYADSEGYNDRDAERPYAYKYRDYVIRSLNTNKPLDTFVHEQLAGDELVSPPYTDLSADEKEKLIATGLLRMAPDGTGGGNDDPEAAKNDVVAETIKIVASSFLGMTVGCAECHDHRFDPILHEDYYRLRAIFEPALDWKKWRSPQQRRVSLATKEDREAAARIEREAAEIDKQHRELEQKWQEKVFQRELAKIPEDLHEAATAARKTPADERTAEQQALFRDYPNLLVPRGGALLLYLELFDEGREARKQLQELQQKASEIRATKPPEDYIRALAEEAGHLPATFVFHRGDYQQPTDQVGPGGLSVLHAEGQGGLPENDPALPTSGRRLAFARRLTSGTHPLFARVIVNRIWMHHFGRGIVGTPGDFGTQGEAPTHPKLLDWLASELVGSGWDLKHIHRLIMTSTVYRQSSKRSDELDAVDPENRLYGRMSVRRLQAEELRDAMLYVSGRLDQTMFGPAVPVARQDTGQNIVGGDTSQKQRRSIYIQVRRSEPLDLLRTFDSPRMEPNCEVRNVSTVAPQALMLLNNEFTVETASQMADRLLSEDHDSLEACVRRAWRLAVSRDPAPSVLDAACEFLNRQQERLAANNQTGAKAADDKADASEDEAQRKARQQALANLCHALLNSNAFVYVD